MGYRPDGKAEPGLLVFRLPEEFYLQLYDFTVPATVEENKIRRSLTLRRHRINIPRVEQFDNPEGGSAIECQKLSFKSEALSLKVAYRGASFLPCFQHYWHW